MFDDEGTRFTLPAEVPLLSIGPATESEDLTIEPFRLISGGVSAVLPSTGIKALMLAVLEDGIRCYFSRARQERVEAEHWVESALRRGAFSFPVLCEMFGVEPGAARQALRRMRARNPVYILPRRRRRAFHHRLAA